MKALTIPVPGEAFIFASTLPKKMYFVVPIVGASFFLLMVNSAPFGPYLRVVPSASSQFAVSAPFFQSVVRVVPNAGSEGQAAEELVVYAEEGWRGTHSFQWGCSL